MLCAMRINVRLSNPTQAQNDFPVISERDSVLHSWCVQTQWQAPTIVGGRAAHFWDANGNDYLDMSSLAGCSNLGHQHPTVVEAIREQAERLCFVTSAFSSNACASSARGCAPQAEVTKHKRSACSRWLKQYVNRLSVEGLLPPLGARSRVQNWRKRCSKRRASGTVGYFSL